MGVGVPLAAATNETFCPAAAVVLDGFVVTVGAVQVGAFTVRAKFGLTLFFQLLLSALLKLPLIFPLTAVVGVSVTVQLELLVDPIRAKVQIPLAGLKVPVPLNENVTVPCGNPFVTGVAVLATVAVQVVALF